MTVCNLRLLLVAAIFISNCITWTASRHHYNHSISGHRIRHRRQGAGQFLSASYVLPGGEGSGWGDWGEVSPCSRTCGGGVASQKRICLQIGPDGTPYCTGGNTKYFTCQTQDCPDVNEDFRAQQCSEFDNKDFRGYKYKWIPYTHVPNPCELTCMPQGERFYYRHKDKVIDGTRCDEDSFNVCVNGQCQPVGCDLMLGSKAVEDKCRVCRGNGESCRTYAEIFDRQDLTQGYTDILLIPEGSTSILIEEIAPSRNYLALRAKDGDYYLNGHYHIDFPRSIVIAGALWNYERSPQGFMAPDRLRTLGPTTEPLYLSLLLQEKNVGIKYEYSVPNTTAPPTDKQYNWVHEEFSPCSHKCGGGIQTRNVTCRSREELEIVDDSLCDDGLKPAVNNICNPDPCPAQWVEGPWGNCSKRCGEGGVRSRVIRCEQIVANGHPSSIIDDNECLKALGPKPDLFEKCNENLACPTWFVGRWKPCDRLCDEGQQTRQVVCHQKVNGRVSLLDDEDCVDEKPETEKSCFLYPCEGVDWVTSKWIGCDSCLSTNRTRTVVCATRQRELVNDSFCSQHNKPVAEETCDPEKLPECEVQWYATQWSKCSVECGEGRQARKVFCGFFDGEAVQKVNDSKCAGQPRYNDTKVCVIPPEQCTMQWFAGPWEKCSKDCDGGEQSRILMCFRGDQQGTGCDKNTMPETARTCNTQPCNEDTLLPISPSAPSITNQLPYCDDEDYPEVGLESELSTTMQADHPTKPSFAEFEVDLGSGSGSGMGSPEPWIPLDSEEGSGFIFNDTDDTTDANNSTDTTTTSSTDSDTNATTTESIIDENNTTTVKPGVSATARPTNPAYRGDIDYDEENATSTINPTTDNENITSDDIKTTTDASNITTGTETDANATDITTAATTLESNTTTESDDANTTMPTPTTSDNLNLTLEAESNVTEATTEPDATGTPLANETTVTESSGVTNTNEIITTTEPSTVHNTSAKSGIPQTTRAPNPAYRGDDVEEVDAHTTTDANTGSTPIGSDDTNATTIIPTTYEDENTTATTPTTSEDANATTAIPTTYEDANATTEANASATTPATSEDANATTAIPTTYEDANATTEANATATTPTTLEDTNATTAIPTTYEDTNATTDANATATTPTTSEDTNATTATPTTYEDTNATTDANATATTPTTSEDANATTAIPTTYEDTNATATTPTTSEDANATTAIPTTYEDTNATATTPTTSEDANATTAIPTTYEDTNATATTPTTSEGANVTTSLPTTFDDTNTTVDYSTTATSNEATTEMSTSFTKATVWVFTTPQRQCIPRPRKCKKTTFGCCPDGKTAASGPFDQGCRRLKTCNETEHGCCPDGVSVASGPNEEGCPTYPCADTLFGCCLSNNKIAAEGNDQQGCPPLCVASEFGCCADNETEATGPEKQGCPESSTTESTTFTTESTTTYTTESTTEFTTESETWTTEGSTTETTVLTTALDGCAVSQFGCCYDNETAASGPNAAGCPCNATEFGCCPDGVSAADGVGQEGCDGNCSLTKYGCCSDGQTPAHGPDFEGCCLTFTYGCCPDNLTPALGPHSEGCECKYSSYGCCPDNVTAAEGPNNQGCGCQYTTYGCCPDRRAAASGTDFEGCSCTTFQFGCCPDGVTHAIGPGQQGCQCQYSQYGCCGDEQTPATGPGGAGCDCTSSKFGCCVDGVTAASGPKFLGCVDVPQNPQGVCSLGTDPGPCHDFVAYWYYDLQYGGCSRFWYGGCEGNGNRFATQDECEDVCVRPAPKDACKLPGVAGPCEGDHVRWYYNSTHEQCTPFRYGGCLGNANNFDTREVCQSHCEPERSADKCSLSIEEGPCAGNYTRWGFDKDTGSCEQFTWGGCEGNANRFSTESACLAHCRPPGTVAPQCTEPPREAGNCSDKQALWSFSTEDNRCLPFYYTGCDGNKNRFDSREGCEALCPSSYEPDKCTLPADSGDCSNYREKWFYDTTNKRCRLFYYGGCGGNENNFESEVECENTCSEAAAFFTTTTTTTTVRPLLPTAAPTPQPAPSSSDLCQLPMQAGPCYASLTRWFYDAASDSCSQFAYGGCQGNENRFETRAECENRCKQSAGTTPASLPGPAETVNEVCTTPRSLAPCGENMTTYYYDTATRQCESGLFGGCQYPNSFSSPEECERKCGEFSAYTRVQICTARLDPGPCRALFPKFYWDPALGKCDEFAYGGCSGGPNRFDTLDECEDFCGDLAPEGSNEVPDCVAYDAECRSLQCANGVVRVPVEDGCERCTCAAPPVNCDSSRQACEALDCTFGIVKTPENGCETCRCAENPCVAQNCGPQEQCMTERIIDSTTQDIIYTARCVPDDNAIAYDCGAYQEECQRLVCPYGVQTSRLANGCERCSCITTETNCDMLTEECDKLRCTYGVDRTTDNDGCVRCSCSLDPCQSNTCLEDQRCVRISYRDPFTQETRYSAECRAVNKPGFCPAEESTNEDCRVECNDDADCRGVSKCCQVGCTRACRVPVEATLPPLTTTYAPDVPRAPEAIAQQEPEVSAAEGGKATLRCVFHGNPPPKITWTYGEVTIDGDQDRYRLLSDGSLEIVSLYRTDSGVYICVADNGLGIARQSITLIVKDPVTTSAGISGDENAAITGELGYPLEVRCLAYGYPPPMVSWTRESDGSMIPFNNAVYRARGNVLLIRRLDLHALGHYTCEAYNGVGVPASWRVAVQAFTPKNYVGQNEYLVPRDLIAPITAVITPEVTRETTTTTSTTTTTEPPSIPVFRVPVSTHITPLRGPLTAGQDLQLTCEVDGYPDPEIYWTKDGARIQSDDRISLSGSVSVSRLTVSRVSPDDAGLYGCHADNQYSSYTDSVQVNIKRGLVVPAKCTDNPFFANCDLIVHSNFCKHKYYSKFCCKSCVEAGQLDPEDAAMQADQPFRRK